MKIPALCIVLACVAAMTRAEGGYRVRFTASSVKSDLFVSLRANKTMVLTSECNKEVTEPYGILEQTYKAGSAESNETCSWRLHAPENHIINVISIIFVMEDEISPSRSDDTRSSTITLYDGTEAVEDKKLTRYVVSVQERVGYFIQSMSSKNDMLVQIKYHENKDFATQRMLINYEFLDVEKMNEILRAL